MRGKALQIMMWYLKHRFIAVVESGLSSSLKRIFSGVPHGGKWSSFLRDFDINSMCDELEGGAVPFGYADDVSLWYEFDANQDRREIIAEINRDMATLKRWGDRNNTTFEKSKMEMVLISQRRVPFDLSGIMFDGFEIPLRPHIKLVGYTIDSKLRRGQMIDRIAKKARARLGALRRVSCFLDSENIKIIYSSFFRSIMEYGSTAWMGAVRSHLCKLE